MWLRGQVDKAEDGAFIVNGVEAVPSGPVPVLRPAAGEEVALAGVYVHGRFTPARVVRLPKTPFAGRTVRVSIEGYVGSSAGGGRFIGGLSLGGTAGEYRPGERVIAGGRIGNGQFIPTHVQRSRFHRSMQERGSPSHRLYERRFGRDGHYNRGSGRDGHYNRGSGRDGHYNRGSGRDGHYNRGSGRGGHYNRGSGRDGHHNRGSGRGGGYERRYGRDGHHNRGSGRGGGYERRYGRDGHYNRGSGQEGRGLHGRPHAGARGYRYMRRAPAHRGYGRHGGGRR